MLRASIHIRSSKGLRIIQLALNHLKIKMHIPTQNDPTTTNHAFQPPSGGSFHSTSSFAVSLLETVVTSIDFSSTAVSLAFELIVTNLKGKKDKSIQSNKNGTRVKRHRRMTQMFHTHCTTLLCAFHASICRVLKDLPLKEEIPKIIKSGR